MEPYIVIEKYDHYVRWSTNQGHSGSEPLQPHQTHKFATVLLLGFRLAGGDGEILNINVSSED